jgi:hypothetical protein
MAANFHELCQSESVSRMWTIQEFLLAQKMTVCCGLHRIDFDYFLIALWWHRRIRIYLVRAQPDSRYLERMDGDLPLLHARARLFLIHDFWNNSQNDPSILDNYFREYGLVKDYMLVCIKSGMNQTNLREAKHTVYLELGRYFQVTEPGDHIYAIYGLITAV